MRRGRAAIAGPAAALALGAGLAMAARAGEPIGPPESHYLLHCSGCHGRDGRGVPGVTPTLHGLGWLARRPAGRAYLASVPGVAQAPVDDAALAALLNWSLARFSGVEADFDAAEVARHRRRPIRDTRAARAALGAPGPTDGPQRRDAPPSAVDRGGGQARGGDQPTGAAARW